MSEFTDAVARVKREPVERRALLDKVIQDHKSFARRDKVSVTDALLDSFNTYTQPDQSDCRDVLCDALTVWQGQLKQIQSVEPPAGPSL